MDIDIEMSRTLKPSHVSRHFQFLANYLEIFLPFFSWIKFMTLPTLNSLTYSGMVGSAGKSEKLNLFL